MHIKDLQEMKKGTLTDFSRGIKGTYSRLMNEIKELGQALKENNREATEKEFVDVIAVLQPSQTPEPLIFKRQPSTNSHQEPKKSRVSTQRIFD
jgi:hypothetical protein